MQLAENAADGWGGVLADLQSQREAALTRLELLRTQKRDLALEAATNGGEAKRKLERIAAELNRVALDLDTIEMAIAAAQAQQQNSSAEAAAEAERARKAELSKLAATAIRHAAEFTTAIQVAVRAGRAARFAVNAMLMLGTPDEQRALTPLLTAAPFMRASEYAGLRDLLEFPAYAGPQAHIGALENEAAVHLGRWLATAAGKEGSVDGGNSQN